MDKISFPKKLFTSYSKFIASNAETCSDIELLSRYMSYFISGKITDDNILSEGLLSLSHLMVIFNDHIIRKEVLKTEIKSFDDEEHKLKLFLTILENVEVFIEITSKRVLGNKKKFMVIFLIQVVKCIGKLVLVIKYKNRISKSPALEYLDRKNLFKNNQEANPLQPELLSKSSVILKLKRSGKTIRKVQNSPPIYNRSFKAPEQAEELEANDRFGMYNHVAIKNAELVYIMKPIVHLVSCNFFGYKSWKSYLLSMFLDVFSIYQYYRHRNHMTSDQKKELSRRCVNMLLYILRSPFYDQFSNDKIDSFMQALNKIPFARLIVEPYRQYIPSYQSTYFYMFSN